MGNTQKNLYFILSNCIIITVLYLYNPFHLYFLADDFYHIPYSAENIWLHRNSLRPIGNLSLHIDFIISKNNALGYHLTNLLLHLMNSFLIGFIGNHFLKKQLNAPTWFFYLVALFFFVYPFHSESIFWIIGRSGSLGTVFFLFAFYFFLLSNKQWKYGIISIFFFQISLLSYESSWIFPIIITAILLFYKKKNEPFNKFKIGYVIFIWLIFFINIFLRISATGELFNHYDAKAFLQFDFVLLSQNFLRLFARTFLPPMHHQQNMMIAFTVVGCIIFILIFFLYKKKKINKFFITLSFIWLISYLPYLSIGIDTHGVEGERYLYLPSVFFCFWILYILKNIFNEKTFLKIVFALMFVQLIFLWQTRMVYVKAGNITKQTLEQIDNLSYKEKIFIENLPQYYKGAVVFRVGLQSALKWLYPKQNSSIIIVSKDDSDEKPKKRNDDEFTILYNENSLPKIVTSILVWNDKEFVKRDTTSILFSINKDAWFSFNDTSLTIVR